MVFLLWNYILILLAFCIIAWNVNPHISHCKFEMQGTTNTYIKYFILCAYILYIEKEITEITFYKITLPYMKFAMCEALNMTKVYLYSLQCVLRVV